jgi:predicted dehydrogenase
MNEPNRPLRVAVVGIGGFAVRHHEALREMENLGRVKVVATCDPASESLQEQKQRFGFALRAISVDRDIDTMLAKHRGQIDLLSIVSPIQFHAAHHRACIENDIACYLEKPPTLDPRELERMIALDKQARFATQVGFNHIGQLWRQNLKTRVLAGEFGKLLRVTFSGLWRRSADYYGRNSWAGRLMLGDVLLLDSCCGNAMAHHLHNLLFHAGENQVMSWAEPKSVEAELYRVNNIESTDTVFARGILSNGVEFRITSSHACQDTYRHLETLECKNAAIEIPEDGPVRILWADGRKESLSQGDCSSGGTVRDNLTYYCNYLIGKLARPATRLSDTRAFVHLNAMLYLASGQIQPVGHPHTRMGSPPS